MSTTNGKHAQDVLNEAQERLNDLGQEFNKGANQARMKLVEQLRDITARIQGEAKKAELDEGLQEQIASLGSQVNTLADVLEKTSVEEMGEKATETVRKNPWIAIAAAFIVGLVIALIFFRRD
jgi:ElaB/YqjD/DUF883 family membrane-anchored ribosome-binding protein